MVARRECVTEFSQPITTVLFNIFLRVWYSAPITLVFWLTEQIRIFF